MPRLGTSARLPASAASAAPSTVLRWPSAQASVGSYTRRAACTRTFSFSGRLRFNITEHSRGTSVSDRISAPIRAETTEYAIGAKMRPSCRCSVKIGMWAAMMISIENSVGRPTSTAASRMRCLRRSSDSSLWPWLASESFLNTFSTTITAPSTMMPKSIAPSDSRLAGIPMKLRPRKVASSASGMVTATIAAARRLPRNIHSTIDTRSAPSSRLVNTVVSVLPISQVRS